MRLCEYIFFWLVLVAWSKRREEIHPRRSKRINFNFCAGSFCQQIKFRSIFFFNPETTAHDEVGKYDNIQSTIHLICYPYCARFIFRFQALPPSYLFLLHAKTLFFLTCMPCDTVETIHKTKRIYLSNSLPISSYDRGYLFNYSDQSFSYI